MQEQWETCQQQEMLLGLEAVPTAEEAQMGHLGGGGRLTAATAAYESFVISIEYGWMAEPNGLCKSETPACDLCLRGSAACVRPHTHARLDWKGLRAAGGQKPMKHLCLLCVADQ